jgi:hypothetical protein
MQATHYITPRRGVDPIDGEYPHTSDTDLTKRVSRRTISRLLIKS